MADDLDFLTRDLLERLRKEQKKPDTTPPAKLAEGVEGVYAKLAPVLREAVRDLAATDAVTVDFIVGRPLGKSRVLSSEIVAALRRYPRAPADMPPRLRALIADIQSPTSLVSRVIEIRSAIQETSRLQKSARETLTALLEWVQAYRKDAGWMVI
jgi:hypothetical protein